MPIAILYNKKKLLFGDEKDRVMGIVIKNKRI